MNPLISIFYFFIDILAEIFNFMNKDYFNLGFTFLSLIFSLGLIAYLLSFLKGSFNEADRMNRLNLTTSLMNYDKALSNAKRNEQIIELQKSRTHLEDDIPWTIIPFRTKSFNREEQDIINNFDNIDWLNSDWFDR